MKNLLIVAFLFMSVSALAATRVGHDLIIQGKRGSNAEKELKFTDQFQFKTASDTGKLTLSVNSGGAFSPLLTASTGGGGGGVGIIVSTPSTTVDRNMAIWNGTNGNALEQAGITLDALNNILGMASLTLSASLTLGSSNTATLHQEPTTGDLICKSNAGGDPLILCGPNKPPSGFAVCHARLENTNGYGSTGAPSFSDKVYQFATLIDECPDGAVTVDNNGGFLAGDGGTFLINTPGKYVVVCSFSVTNNVNVGVTKNVIADSQGNTVFNSVTTANKVCTAGPGQSDGSTGCMGVITLQTGEILTCHGDGVASEVVQGNSFFYIERIR